MGPVFQMIMLTATCCYMFISVTYIYKKTKLELTLNLPVFLSTMMIEFASILNTRFDPR